MNMPISLAEPGDYNYIWYYMTQRYTEDDYEFHEHVRRKSSEVDCENLDDLIKRGEDRCEYPNT